ncbi:MAG: MFS transporter [Pseudomonadota bacterium]
MSEPKADHASDAATPPRATASTATQLTLVTAVLVLAPFALSYFLSYLYRAVNAVVAPRLVADFQVDPAQLGVLTAAYLLAFAAFQLPLGVLLDRFGPRRVQAVLMVVAAGGAAWFALADSFAALTASRALIGLGVAGGLMSGFKAVVLFVPAPRRALANACVMSVGAIGLLVATAPTEWAVQAYGWRWVFAGLAGLSVLVAALIMVMVPREGGDTPAGEPVPLRTQVRDIGRILSDAQVWALAPLLATTAGTHIAIQTLWAGQWFRDVAGLNRDATAQNLFWMAVAFFAGILFTGGIADRLVQRGLGLLDVMLGFVVLFIASQAAIIVLPAEVTFLPWLIFGALGQVAILAYPWLSSHFGTALSGRANTAMNFLIFTSAFAIQAAIGAIIGAFTADEAGRYPQAAYDVAFGLFLLAQLIALVWYLLARTRHRA